LKREELFVSMEELLSQIYDLYGLCADELTPFGAHEGGRNLVLFTNGEERRVIRVSYLEDRQLTDYQAETEYVRHLHCGGASVANVIASKNGNDVEVIHVRGAHCYVSMFEYARGDLLADRRYRYREGAPLAEYFLNCGKVLGQMHELSKEYRPRCKRFDFFEKYTPERIDSLVPESHPQLRQKLKQLLTELSWIERTRENYGMVHFDYSDGNYHIDYRTGDITVFDFDNCCTCWYVYDLANLWAHGVGWVSSEPDAEQRRAFMEHYFSTILKGYRAETELPEDMSERLRQFVQAVLMENILDEFETQQAEGEYPEIDGEMQWRIWCMMEEIPFFGFFHESYDVRRPFEISD